MPEIACARFANDLEGNTAEWNDHKAFWALQTQQFINKTDTSHPSRRHSTSTDEEKNTTAQRMISTFIHSAFVDLTFKMGC